MPDPTLTRLNCTVDSLDPVAAQSTGAHNAVLQAFDTLVTHPNGEPEVEPLLATRWRVSDDQRRYTFKLKRDIPFHDDAFGTVTAADIVYSFERLAASPQSVRRDFALDYLGVAHETDADGDYRPGTIGVRALDDYTVEVELDRPFHDALGALAHPACSILPAGVVGDIPGYDGVYTQAEFASHPVGTGPFVFQDRSYPDTEAGYSSLLEFDRFDDYHGERAELGGLRIRTCAPSSENWDGILAGEVTLFNVSSEYDPDRVTVEREDDFGRRFGTYELDNGRTVQHQAAPTLTTWYMGFDTGRVPRGVRRAVAYALDARDVARGIYNDTVLPAWHLTPPVLFPGGASGYRDHRDAYPYGDESRLDAARDAAADVGVGSDDPFTLDLAVPASYVWDDVGSYFADALAGTGVEVVEHRVPSSGLQDALRDGDANAYLMGATASQPTLDGMLGALDPERTGVDADDATAWLDWSGTDAADRAAAAWDRIRDNPEPSATAERARENAALDVEEAAWADVPLLPLGHQVTLLFWYDHVEVPPVGPLGMNRQKYNRIRVVETEAEVEAQ
jgi:peptide/nickel transport system substrate-binding protein